MATLKAIKNNYDLLTMPERFGLYQKASLRRDESELAAIYGATPMKEWRVIDFYFLREEIYRLDTINMLSRLGHSAMFETFVRLGGDEEKHPKDTDYFYEASSLSAYLYVIETDAWKIVCDDLGFEADWFRTLASALSYAVQVMDVKDQFMRDCAFDESDAQKFLIKSAKRLKFSGINTIKTLNEQIKFYRGLIEAI